MKVGPASGPAGRRAGRRRAKRFQPMSEINVTPFVDVMLVLLIIFMVSAPLLTVGVPVDLPESSAKPLEGNKEPLTVTIQSEGTIYLQDQEITLETLVERLSAIAEDRSDERILVRGDASTQHGTVIRVLGELNRAGFNRIGLVTNPDER